MLASGCARPPAITSDLDLEMNPSGRTPLAGLIRFTTDQPARATLTITDGEHTSTVMPSDAFVTEHELMVLGLRPGRLNTVEVAIENESGETGVSASVDVTTEPLPDDFPPIDVTLSRPARMEPGFTIIPVTRAVGQEFDEAFGVALAIDAQGEVVWYYETDHDIDELRPLSNGNFIYRSFRTDLYEIDMLGQIVRHWVASAVREDISDDAIRVPTDTFHHDVVELDDGNLLVLSTEVRSFDSYPTSLEDPEADWAAANVIGDVLVEFEPDTGQIKREWKFFDLLDPLRLGYGSLNTGYYERVYAQELEQPAYDWAHGNGLFYDARTDSVLVSINNQSIVFKLDLDSGEIVWILGHPEGWKDRWQRLRLQPTSDMKWFWHQHAPELTPNDTLLLYDNGNRRAFPPTPPILPPETYSRAVEFRIDEAAGTVEEIWSYGGPADDWFFSSIISEADWLPTAENVLITTGARVATPDGAIGANVGDGRAWISVAEVTHTSPADKVWEVIIDDPAVSWYAYRSERIPSLYPES